MTPCILYRPGHADPEEEGAARQHFPVYRYRTQVPPGSLVVPRYCALPFGDELEQDVRALGSVLINTYAQHQHVARLDYYDTFSDVTFPTWFRFEDVPRSARSGAFVVKGRTNSRKFEWAQRMYAPNFESAVRIGADLLTDGLISAQGVVLRQFVPLETFEYALGGLPLTNEWRVFYYRGQRLAYGYYWGNLEDWTAVDRATPDFLQHGLPFADELAARVVEAVPFVVLDIAKTAAGQWMLVELNDGAQAGLNGVIDPVAMYGALARALAPRAQGATC